MVILTDRFLSDQYSPGASLFIKDLIAKLALRNPVHQFVMLAEQIAVAGLPSNITIYPINSLLFRWVGKKIWYRYILPVISKKLGATVFICFNNLYGPLAQVPSCLFLTGNAADLVDNGRGSGNGFLAACRRSRSVVCFSGYYMQQLQQRYPAVSRKFVHLKPGIIHPTAPLGFEAREAAKALYAGGLEYFAFAGDLSENHLLTALLKAFSIFKKWQRSNMQLVIAGSTTRYTAAWLQTLSTYKHRNDIHVMPDATPETCHAVIAGAYAFVYPAIHDRIPVNVLVAMQAGVPVVTSGMPLIEELAGDAVMVVAANDASGFATGMQTIYKDERTRDSLIEKGFRQMELNGQDMAEDCWHILMNLSHRTL